MSYQITSENIESENVSPIKKSLEEENKKS